MVTAYIPYPRYVSISITGIGCALNCRYCSRTYLKHMPSALTPQQLYWLMRKLYREGVRGFLISGGFTREGKLPFHGFLDVIREFKSRYEVVISIHSGLVDVSEARMLREARVDVVDFEFSLNPTYTSVVKGLGEKFIDKMAESLKALYLEGPEYIAPHIIIGSSLGLLGNEFSEIDFLRDYNPYLIVALIYTPTPGTPSHKDPEPRIDYVLSVLKYLKRVSKGEVGLGCMRPWGKYRLELDKIVVSGKLVDRIANPPLSIVKDYNLRVINACCSLPREYEYLFTNP